MHASATGYFGLSEASGWALYSRVALFADCTRFDPPEGTRALCETTPASERPGADFYGHEPGSPARRLFGEPPAGDEQLSEFARSACSPSRSRMRPTSAATSSATSTRPSSRRTSPGSASRCSMSTGAPGDRGDLAAALNSYYADDRYEIDSDTETLADLQDVLRVHPAAAVRVARRRRAGAGRGRLRWDWCCCSGPRWDDGDRARDRDLERAATRCP